MPEEYKPSPKKGKATTRTLQYPLHQQPCAEGCANFSKRSSNATHENLSCIVCGHSTTAARRQVPKFVYDQCPHDNTDFRGSDKNTHRVYCLGCCSAITEMPLALHKKQKKVIYDATRSGEIILRDIVRESVAPDVPRDQILQVARAFSEVVQGHLRSVPSNSSGYGLRRR